MSPTHWFRAIWAVCGLFVIAVAAIILWNRSHPRTMPYIPSGTLPSSASVPDSVRTLPNGEPRTPGNSISGTISSTPTSSGQVSTPVRNPGDASSTNSAGGSGFISVASREQTLTELLSKQGSLLPGVSLTAVKVDARGQSVSVSLVQRVAGETSESETRAAVARSGVLAALSVFGADAAYANVTLEIKLAIRDAQPQPFFEGDIDRAIAQRSDVSLRDEERFKNVWWATSQTPNPPNIP